MPVKLTRKEAKERTRERLIQGLIDVARAEGLQGLTTTKVAKEAGVAQSSFYFHFDGMDDALQAAADYLGHRMIDRIRNARRQIDPQNPLTSLRASYDAVLGGYLDEPTFTQLFLRHRRDPTSPIGRRFAQLLDESRRGLAEDLSCANLGIAQADVYAEMFIAMGMAMVEGILDGRLTSRDACLDALVHVCGAALATMPRDGEPLRLPRTTH